MNKTIVERLTVLRSKMKEEGADWYLITSEDFHGSEYVADYFKVREFYTNFTGDNATLVLNDTNAWMWTDGRFFIQADIELEGTGIELMKMGEEGVPRVSEFLSSNVKKGEKLYLDGRTIAASIGETVKKALEENEAFLVSDKDIAGDLWDNRPALPSNPIMILSDDIAGETVADKLSRIRKEVSDAKCDANFIAKLDDIMWITNLRGADIACNPVALSYFYCDSSEAVLFVQKSEQTEELKDFLSKSGVVLKDYFEVSEYIKTIPNKTRVLVDDGSVNLYYLNLIKENAEAVCGKNPSTLMKAIKNKTELSRIRDITIKDSAVVSKFIYWLKKNIGKIEITEVSAAEHLDNLRSELEGFIGLSFPTISGYGPNAAMMHYEATPESHAVLKPEGMLLVDSGGQYTKGTTDITRTIVLGPVSDEVKCHFSKVAAGMLALADAKFLYGCTGRNIDILARLPLWEINIDYKCGTGHGVGYILNVHEGPQSFRWKYIKGIDEAVLEEGMIVTDEPGVYIENSHGIRTENEVVCVKGEKNSDGQFMGLEHLTYTPIDREALDKKYLSEKDIERINAYHSKVYELTSEYMNEEERAWLWEVTRPL